VSFTGFRDNMSFIGFISTLPFIGFGQISALYRLVNKVKLMHNFSKYVYFFSFIPPYIPDIHTVTNTKCIINTVVPPDDGHTVARNT